MRPGSRFPARALLSGALLLASCTRERPPGDDASPEATGGPSSVPGAPFVPPELSARPAAPVPSASSAEPPAPPPWEGPYLVITDGSAGVYQRPVSERKEKIGYIQSGGRVPVYAERIENEGCAVGWYHAAGGGYICGSHGSTDAKAPEVRFARRQPAIGEVLPYTYARNAKNGTPLYKSVPTPEQMYAYEPYLPGAKKESASAGESEGRPRAKATAGKDRAPPTSQLPAPAASSFASAGAPTPVAPTPVAPPAEPSASKVTGDGGAPRTPWWQNDDADDRLHEVSLAQLTEEADDFIAKRMVKGFYVAVDKQFSWNNRPWYKTTKGLIAPADRFWVTKGSSFQGAALPESELRLPLGWAHGWQKQRPRYALESDGKTLKPAGQLQRFERVSLTGKEQSIGGTTYVEALDGTWIKKSHLRITEPGPPPADLRAKERWVDVNLSAQTLVAFEGTQPVYATLISSGKENRDKEKDHRTPSGEWRIREKHVTTTMDGDGSAAGDLPYSIEDVPYVMYFYRAYALHGAFWHENYGSQMSHGCVNLAPLDAKWIFFFTEPLVPEGWHGAWSTEEKLGSRVVVHE